MTARQPDPSVTNAGSLGHRPTANSAPPVPDPSRRRLSASIEIYNPCRDGIHVCGIDPAVELHFTEVNIPWASRADFDRVRAECACRDGDPDDFMVDFMCAGDILDDFPMSRQMLNRLVSMVGR
jgi:hypothetical protein